MGEGETGTIRISMLKDDLLKDVDKETLAFVRKSNNYW